MVLGSGLDLGPWVKQRVCLRREVCAAEHRVAGELSQWSGARERFLGSEGLLLPGSIKRAVCSRGDLETAGWELVTVGAAGAGNCFQSGLWAVALQGPRVDPLAAASI